MAVAFILAVAMHERPLSAQIREIAEGRAEALEY
jgi:hypothetical protein